MLCTTFPRETVEVTLPNKSISIWMELLLNPIKSI
jgi:hypothetical protein